MVQENGEKRARKENGTRNNTDSCWCFILVLTGFSTMIIDKHWGPSCQASDPWRQNGLRLWGHILFLRASRSSWSFPNMFHSSRGAGCPCIPAQRRGLHATLISLETSSDVPAIHFLILICRYGKGLSREPQDMIFFVSFYKAIVGSVTQSRGARPFWGFIPRCHRIDKKDRQVRWTNQDSIRHTVFQVCAGASSPQTNHKVAQPSSRDRYNSVLVPTTIGLPQVKAKTLPLLNLRSDWTNCDGRPAPKRDSSSTFYTLHLKTK